MNGRSTLRIEIDTMFLLSGKPLLVTVGNRSEDSRAAIPSIVQAAERDCRPRLPDNARPMSQLTRHILCRVQQHHGRLLAVIFVTPGTCFDEVG